MQDKEKKTYDEIFYNEIINSVDSLWIKDEQPPAELQIDAARMFKQGTKEGRIAAIDLYSHLIEEILKIIIRYIRFIFKLVSYPERVIEFDLERKSLGALIILIEDSIGFAGKKIILQKSNKIRKSRNRLMHDLIKRYHQIDVIQDTEGLDEVYEELQDTFLNMALLSLGRKINELKKREAIVQLMEKFDR